MPATIDDPTILEEIEHALKAVGDANCRGSRQRCGATLSCDLPSRAPRKRPEPNVERAGLADKYGIRRRHALHVIVYTAVCTDIENSGHLGPCASEEPQPKTSSMRTMRAALSTQVLFSPQLPKLFGNRPSSA